AKSRSNHCALSEHLGRKIKLGIMELHDKIQDSYRSSKNYPELVKALIGIGVLSYTVDVSSSTILYRFAGGQTVLHAGEMPLRGINETFNNDETVRAIKDNQQ